MKWWNIVEVVEVEVEVKEEEEVDQAGNTRGAVGNFAKRKRKGSALRSTEYRVRVSL